MLVSGRCARSTNLGPQMRLRCHDNSPKPAPSTRVCRFREARPHLPGFGRLLGLVTSHFNVPAPIGEGLGVNFGSSIEELTVPANTGMAVVTPSDYLRELLLRDDVLEDRSR